MLTLRCTRKLIQELARAGHELGEEPAEIPQLHEWYANLFRLERRKCLIFTHATTLFTFVVPGVTKPHFVALQKLMRDSLEVALRAEGFGPEVADRILGTQDSLQILPTRSRSVLGSMNDFVHMTRVYIDMEGGLAHVDVAWLNRNLNVAPMSALGYGRPVDAFAEMIRQDGSLRA
jgi:hypothetical protein